MMPQDDLETERNQRRNGSLFIKSGYFIGEPG